MKSASKKLLAAACVFFALLCFTVGGTYAWFAENSRRIKGSFATLCLSVEIFSASGEVLFSETLHNEKEETYSHTWEAVGNSRIVISNYSPKSVNGMLILGDYTGWAEDGTMDFSIAAPEYIDGELIAGKFEVTSPSGFYWTMIANG